MTTFGFEAEFQEGADELVTYMSSNTTHMRTRELHRYHCDCEDCVLDYSIYNRPIADLRAQRDSTCSGEIISRIFESIDQALPVFEALENAAVESDAVPGPNAGFHVHVGVPRRNSDFLVNAFFEWIRWEPIVKWLASGRWADLRDMNTDIRNNVHWNLVEYRDMFLRDGLIENDVTWHPGRILNFINAHDNPLPYKQNLYNVHYGADRHSQLSINTRYRTWEFRIWNSTRSAWRMELACRLSLIWMNSTFIENLRAYTDVPESNYAHATECLIAAAAMVDEPLSVLINRQYDYLSNRVDEAPTTLTTIA